MNKPHHGSMTLVGGATGAQARSARQQGPSFNAASSTVTFVTSPHLRSLTVSTAEYYIYLLSNILCFLRRVDHSTRPAGRRKNICEANKHCQMSNQIRRVSDRTRCAAPFVRDPLTIKKHVSHARTQGLVSILATRRRDELLGVCMLGKVRCVCVRCAL